MQHQMQKLNSKFLLIFEIQFPPMQSQQLPGHQPAKDTKTEAIKVNTHPQASTNVWGVGEGH